jgi:YbgC/YbaW family acyl-CoA thioester hydrolase
VTSEHRLRRRVHFYETDMAGLVHFSVFFRYMEEAEHALWRAAGLTIATVDEEFGFPRVSASFDFHAPLRFEDEFEVWIRIAEITKRTLRYTCVLTRVETKIATGTHTIACVSKKKGERMRSIDFPPDVLARLSVSPEA